MSYALSAAMIGRENEARLNVKGGRKWNFARRLVHWILSLAIIYYWLPDPLFIEGFRRWYVLLGAVLIACTVEFVRLKRKKIFLGMRSYEEARIASYVYAIIGVAVVLSISPDIVGVPCILGMALCDPLAGELRHAKVNEMRIAIFTAITYAFIALFSLTILRAEPITMILLIAVMTPLAVLSEQIDIKHLDDDLMMLVVPALAGMLLVKII
jgi:hypothetical protein